MSRALPPRSRVATFEATLFDAADKLRQDMDAAEYKHVVLALIFLRSVERLGSRIVVPREASWRWLRAERFTASPGRALDHAMDELERTNPALSGTLFRGFSGLPIERSGRLLELVDMLDGIALDDEDKADTLGRIYEYFLERFARAEGHRGGQFYTPRCVVELLSAMLEPTSGVVYDPCCGSGGMFVQGAAPRVSDKPGSKLRFVGQESNRTTWRLCRMNLVLHDLDGDLGPHEADTFLDDRHPDVRADFVLSNPPFNAKDWGGERLRDDPRWKHGRPPLANANFAWIQHILHHLGDRGRAAIVLANGTLSSDLGGEAEIRRSLVEAGLVECVVALPPQLFFSTTIPVSVWCLSKQPCERVLFLHATPLGALVDRAHRALGDADITRIADAYKSFRGAAAEPYRDVPGFSRAASLEEVARHRYALVPGRYVGFEPPPPEEATLSRITEEIRLAERALERVDGAVGFARELLLALKDGVFRG